MLYYFSMFRCLVCFLFWIALLPHFFALSMIYNINKTIYTCCFVDIVYHAQLRYAIEFVCCKMLTDVLAFKQQDSDQPMTSQGDSHTIARKQLK